MNRAVLTVIALATMSLAGWAADSVDDMIALSQRGLSDDVLLAKVDAGSNPSLSTQDILRLKDGRVSDRVIAAMIRKGASAPSVDYTATKYSSAVSDPVIGRPEPVVTVPVRERIIERTVQPAYSYSTPVVYSQPVYASYSSPVVYAGYSRPYYGGGYYSRPSYSSYYSPRYYGNSYYGGGYGGGHYHYHRGHYHYHRGGHSRGGFGFGFRF